MGQIYFLENLGLGKIKSQTTRIYTPDFVGSLQNLSHMDNYQMIIEICSKTIQIFNFLSVCQKSILGLTHYNTNLVRVLHVKTALDEMEVHALTKRPFQQGSRPKAVMRELVQGGGYWTSGFLLLSTVGSQQDVGGGTPGHGKCCSGHL